MKDYTYQHGFSALHREDMYDQGGRYQKARKTLAVLTDFIATTDNDPANLSLLDIGCSTGHMTQVYGSVFGKVVGMDIDEPAVRYAEQINDLDNVIFSVSDSMALGFEDNVFDCVTCTQIYEHVPDANRWGCRGGCGEKLKKRRKSPNEAQRARFRRYCLLSFQLGFGNASIKGIVQVCPEPGNWLCPSSGLVWAVVFVYDGR